MADNAPAAASPPAAAPPAPPAGPPKSSVELASEAARAHIAEGKPLNDFQPRTADGKFAAPRTREAGDPPKPDDETPPGGAPSAGQDDEDDERKPDDGEEPKPGEKPQAGAGDDEGARGAGDEGDEVDPKLVVQLLGRGNGDDPVEIVVDSPEVAERLRQSLNGAMRREEFEQRTQEMDRVMGAFFANPADFMYRQFKDEPEVMSSLALYLVTRPEVWKQVGDQVLRMQDPEAFETVSQKAENGNWKLQQKLEADAAARAEVQQNLREVQSSVQSMIPPDMEPDQQATLYRALMLGVKDYADRNHLHTVDPRDIPLMVSHVLRDHGLDPVEVAQRRTSTGSGAGGRSRREAPAPKNGAPATPPAKSGKDFVSASQRRAAAAGVAPAGAGAPASGGTAPPAGQSIEERIAWHRKHRGQR